MPNIVSTIWWWFTKINASHGWNVTKTEFLKNAKIPVIEGV
jgi:hypothetical protein